MTYNQVRDLIAANIPDNALIYPSMHREVEYELLNYIEANRFAPTGTTSDYIRGDGSIALLNTTIVPEGTALYYTDARARASLSNSAPITYNSLTGAIGITQSSSVASGYLSNTDWNAFNSKENAITAGTTSQYWRGDKTWQTLDKAAVGLSNVENTALSTWTGSTNLTTLGTVVTGVWNGTTIGVSKGGTGLSSLGAANTLLSVDTTGSAAEYRTLNLATTGTDVSWSYGAGAITLALPSASSTARGLITTGTQTIAGAKTFSSDLIVNGNTVGRGGGNRANNLVMGAGAGAATMTNSTSFPNTIYGAGAGAAITGGYAHMLFGYRAGYNITGGDDNILMGYRAGYNLTLGYYNLGIGTDVFFNLYDTPTTSFNNLAIGHNTARNLASGSQRNTIVGLYALGNGSNTGSTSHNTALGEAVLYNLYGGNFNTGVGRNVFFTATNASFNTGVGYNAGYYVTGSSNLYLGGFDGTGFTTLSNQVFISDGEGNVRMRFDASGNLMIKHTTYNGYTVDINGSLRTTTTLTTGQPSGSGAGAYKLGNVITTSGLALVTTEYVEVEINGVIKKLALVN